MTLMRPTTSRQSTTITMKRTNINVPVRQKDHSWCFINMTSLLSTQKRKSSRMKVQVTVDLPAQAIQAATVTALLNLVSKTRVPPTIDKMN